MNLSEDRKPVYNPVRPSGDTILSSASFGQWYQDVLGVNLSQPLMLTLSNGTTAPGGIYTYENSSFWPINNQLFGNQGLNKNFHFTFELHTKFGYQPGQKFKFIGDDDVWVYVNGNKVIDLGGVHAAETAEVLLFDGKAFINKNHFATSGPVQVVSETMKNAMATKWTALGLGTCPILKNDKYIDLNLHNGMTEVRGAFTTTTSVKCHATANLSKVTLKFVDGSEQTFENLNVGTSKTFSGTGASSGKVLAGAWIRAGNNNGGSDGEKGTYVSADGASAAGATLDFFFAERHTTQSNFRIDTSILLEIDDEATISPLYD